MATGKKSFLLYTDYANIFYELTDNEAGQLIKHLFKYVNDEDPILDDRLLKLVFEPIKSQLKRDLKSWEKTIEGRSDGGKLGNLKRWNNDLFLQVNKGKITIDEAETIAKDRKVSVSDNNNRSVSVSIAPVAVTVNDTVNVINISFSDFWNLYDKKRGDKDKLEKKWNNLKDNDRTLIMAYLPEYKESQPDKKYRRDPETFLNNKGWLDEIIKSNFKSNGVHNKMSVEANPEDF